VALAEKWCCGQERHLLMVTPTNGDARADGELSNFRRCASLHVAVAAVAMATRLTSSSSTTATTCITCYTASVDSDINNNIIIIVNSSDNTCAFSFAFFETYEVELL
jgi:hypothetical protein